MSCIKCCRMTSANYDSVYTCNHCSEKQKAVPRCRFDVDLTDETDTVTASIFGELAESLLSFTALEALECYNKNKGLPLENVHRQLKEKMFIAQLKPGNTKDGSGNHRYTVAYYFEENASTSSFNKDSCISVQNQFIQAEQQNSEAGSSEGQEPSSKRRVRLRRRFKDAGEMEEEPAPVNDFGSTKKTKLV